MLFSLASFLLSVGLGLSCAINRLLDIRSTRSIARYREQWLNENVEIDEIDRRLSTRRANAKRFGKRSWRIFWWQLGTFALGVAMLIIAFGIAYREKLF